MKLYIINYEHNHKQWSATLHAENWQDAEKRLAALKAAGVDMSHHNMQQILARLIIRGWVDSKLIKRGSTRVKYYWLTEYGQQYFEGLR